jgi:hypothetical protein
LAWASVLCWQVFSQLTPWPLQSPFVIYLLVLLGVAALIARTEETVTQPRRPSDISLRPRVGIPAATRARFVAPAVAVFNAMALVGFYAALIPSILVQALHEPNHAIAGAVVCELTLVVAVVIILTRRLNSRMAMLWGLGLVFPSLVLLVATQSLGSMGMLLSGTAISGASTALGYRGSLEVINKIAPAERRAELVSSYFVVGFIGNALPVIGVGLIASAASLLVASVLFAVMLAGFAIVGLFIETSARRVGEHM